MRLHDGVIEVEGLVGRMAIVRAQAQVDALRRRFDQLEDSTTSLTYFLFWAAVWDGLPVALLMRRQGVFVGVVLLYLRRRFGVPVGIARAGNGVGQGSFIGDPSTQIEMMETACRVLLKLPIIHTVLLSINGTQPGDRFASRLMSGAPSRWSTRDASCRLHLSGGIAATMERLGYKMRRNLRYYRRRAESEVDARFVPDLTPEQRREAVSALHDKCSYAYSPRRAKKLEAGLLAMPGHFAAGVQRGSGEWLSYVAGWRAGDVLYVDWQLNDDRYKTLSVSTLMRGYLLEHELARESSGIVFVGGTTSTWSRACEVSLCSDLLAVRAGFIGHLTRSLTMRVTPRSQLAQLHRSHAPSGRRPFAEPGSHFAGVDETDGTIMPRRGQQ